MIFMNDRFDLDDLTNADIYDQDSKKVGSIGQVYLDDQTDEAKFATVKTGLFGTNETFVPLNAATRTEDGGVSGGCAALVRVHIDWEEVLLSFKKALRQTLTLIIQTEAHVQKYCEAKKKRRLEK